MVTIVIISLGIVVLFLGDKLWYHRTPTWFDDLFLVLWLLAVTIDAVLIGCKLAKMSGIL